MTCVAACWTPVPCPTGCGNNLPPRGRDVHDIPDCCQEHRYDDINRRHLWHQDEALADHA